MAYTPTSHVLLLGAGDFRAAGFRSLRVSASPAMDTAGTPGHAARWSPPCSDPTRSVEKPAAARPTTDALGVSEGWLCLSSCCSIADLHGSSRDRREGAGDGSRTSGQMEGGRLEGQLDDHRAPAIPAERSRRALRGRRLAPAYVVSSLRHPDGVAGVDGLNVPGSAAELARRLVPWVVAGRLNRVRVRATPQPSIFGTESRQIPGPGRVCGVMRANVRLARRLSCADTSSSALTRLDVAPFSGFS